MRKTFLSILLASSVLAWAGDVIVSSPDGQLKVTVSTDGGRAYYSAELAGQTMLQPSALGLKTSIGDLTRDLTLIGNKQSTVDNAYQMRGTKASSAHYTATKAVLDFKNKDGIQMSIVFQVSNHDVAFRYEMPRQTVNRKEYKRARILSVFLRLC